VSDKGSGYPHVDGIFTNAQFVADFGVTEAFYRMPIQKLMRMFSANRC